jgi:DNA-directed RNA polymerase subunit F
MRILNQQPIPTSQVKAYVNDFEERKALEVYLKKFSKLSKDKSESLMKDLKALNNPKIRESDIIKVVDFIPKDAEELNKIFSEVSLSEEETNAILEIIKKY